MAQIREIKKRIKSIGSTQKVTHAMELVAAAKMRKAQIHALSSRPYSLNLHHLLYKAQAQGIFDHPLISDNEAEKELLILVTSDRGLAGGLNLNVFRELTKNEVKHASYITVGKKALQFVSKMRYETIASFGSEEVPFLELARTLSKMAIDSFTGKEYSSVSMLYPHFESTVVQIPQFIQILPIKPVPQEEAAELVNSSEVLFEPSVEALLNTLLPHHVLQTIYQVLLEAKASEHSARMVAMKNATDAAGDLIDDLTLTYNQARQEAITKELLDIVTAQRAFQ